MSADRIPDDIHEAAINIARKILFEAGAGVTTDKLELATKAAAIFLMAERERCAEIAGRDVDWTRFGKRDLEPWESGRDDIRDYRLGIVTGRAIAATIRNGR